MVGPEIRRKVREIDARGNDKKQKERECIVKQSCKSRTNIFMLAIVLGALIVGFMIFAPGSDDSRDAKPYPANNYVPEKSDKSLNKNNSY
ncbi:MAG: hypothetical protein V1854_05530 [Methanobacteriota archaeon]